MAIVQTAYGEDTGPNAVATFGTAVTSGNTVLLMFFLGDYASSDPGGTGSGLSGASNSPPDVLFDDKYNAYTKLQIRAPVDSPVYNPAAGVYFYACSNITNAPTVFTLHDSSFRFTLIQAVELSGRDNALVVGVNSPGVPFTTTSTPSTSFTTGTADEDVIQITLWDGLGIPAAFTAGSGWTKAGPTTSSTYGVAVRNCATATSYNADSTLGSNQQGDILYLSLRAAAGGGTTVTPGAGALSLSGLAPSLVRGTVRSPGAGALTLAGRAPSLVRGTVRSPGAGALTLAGRAPTLVVTANRIVTPGAGALTLAGLAPSVLRGAITSPGAGALALSGLAPSIISGVSVFPGAGALVLSGLVPTITATDNQAVSPGAGALVLSGLAPDITATDNQAVTPDVGALTLTGLPPVVVATDNQTVAPGAGVLALAGLTPTVIATAAGAVQPGAGALVLQGLAPVVAATANQTVTPGAGALILQGLAPSVLVSQIVAPGAADLRLVGYGPQIVVTDQHTVTPGAGALGFVGLAPTVVVEGSFTVTPGSGTLTLEGLAPTVTSQPTESLLSARFIAKHKNVKFKPLRKKEIEAPLPAEITNMADGPPLAEPLTTKLAAGLAKSLHEVWKQGTVEPVTAPAVPEIKAVSKPSAPAPKAPKLAEVPPPPTPIKELTQAEIFETLLKDTVTRVEKQLKADTEVLRVALLAENEQLRGVVDSVQARLAAMDEIQTLADQARVAAVSKKMMNQRRAQEITQKLLNS